MLISCDAAQLEWRVAVELSQDQVGLEEIINKLDTHAINQETFGLPTRLISKIYLFRTIFRGSGWSFANDPNFTHVSTDPDFWDDINRKFYAKYSGLDACHQRWISQAWKSQPIVGPFGREWGFSPVLNDRGELRVPIPSLTNYPVQGTGADVLSIARVSAFNRIRALRENSIKFITTVHDSLVVDAPQRFLVPITELFVGVFMDLQSNIKKVFNYEWKTPLTCEVFYGSNLKDLHEIKLFDAWASPVKIKEN